MQNTLKIPSYAESTGQLDTRYLLAELCNTFRKTGQPVSVDFRGLVNWVRLGDQLTHQVYPYPAKLLPHIANFFLRCGSVGSGRVLDPFCGSGTVALEASICGGSPLVADANPFALLLTKVKTNPYEVEELLALTSQILYRARRFRTAPEIAVVNSDKWYAPETKKKLEILRRAVFELDDGRAKDFFKVCFALTAKRLSTTDPRISVPVKLKEKPGFSESANAAIRKRLAWIEVADPIEDFAVVCRDNIARVAAANRLAPARRPATIVGNDARNLQDIRDIPLVLTSPPYGTAQKYVRAVSLSLNWLEFAKPGELTVIENATIGREHTPRRFALDLRHRFLPDFEKLLNRVESKNAHRAELTRLYLCEMLDALESIRNTVSSRGRAVIVIGNNQVCGEVLETDKFIRNAMEEAGWTTSLRLIDSIKSRGLLTKRNDTAGVISHEHILVFDRK
jgi:tRNA G10  N-methylase Trm11